jgi:membrane-bound lytic murein transglycosylase D
VPKFYAAAILGSDPEAWGFTPAEDPPPATESMTVDFCVDFDVLGECAGVSPETLAELNPALVRRCTPPDEEGFPVAVPAGTAGKAAAALAALPESQRVRWAHHRVRSGDTLSVLAQRYHTSVSAIQQANGLRSAHFLSIGQDLLIPEGGGPGVRPPRLASAGSGTTRIVYTVRRGDTLSEIAERHGTSARKLRRWNRIGKYIHPGDRLTIHVDPLRMADSGGRSATVRVQRGDTLWDIARRYGVSLGSLLRENNLGASHLIRPGDLLRIPRS